MYQCPIHGTHFALLCTQCLKDVANVMPTFTNYSPPNVWPDGVKLGNDLAKNEPLAHELSRQRSEDRAEVERLIDSIEGVR